MPCKKLFVTATDTNTGKTVFCALLIGRLLKEGKKVAYFKPIQTGCQQNEIAGRLEVPDPEFVRLKNPIASVQNTYALKEPATPELAARLENTQINFSVIKDDLAELEKKHDFVIIEGAGGLLVPVCEGKTIADLIVHLEVPALLVSANRLGSINHTCLSAFYGQNKGIKLLGFVFNDIDLPFTAEPTVTPVKESNAQFIVEYSSIQCLGEIMHFDINDDAAWQEAMNSPMFERIQKALT